MKRWKRISPQEIRQHNTSDDCWLIANNKVYDATPMITNHPGGKEAICRKCGQDCTQDYEFHSSKARKEEWSRLQIGILEPSHRDRCLIS